MVYRSKQTITAVENEFINDIDIKLIPNPASDIVRLYNLNIVSGSWRIYNNQNQLITLGKFDSEKFELDVSKFSPGMYIVQMDSENNQYRTKLVVLH